ncbi:MAG: hypothetical protein VKK04_19100 [Synechococcales bacterium]|nr:hypothetical protein [Synechococcales bacterium]
MSTTPLLQPPQKPPLHPDKLQSCQAIAFQIANHWLALPHAALLQIVHQTALNKDVKSNTLAYLGKQPLSILDLHPLLATVRGDRLFPQDQYLLTEGQVETQFFLIVAVDTTIVGIPVNQLPVLIELPLTEIHPVPPSYYSAICGIASHVVAVPQLGAVFLLNLNAVYSGLRTVDMAF